MPLGDGLCSRDIGDMSEDPASGFLLNLFRSFRDARGIARGNRNQCSFRGEQFCDRKSQTSTGACDHGYFSFQPEIHETPCLVRIQSSNLSSAALVGVSMVAPGGRIVASLNAPRRRSTSLRMAIPMPS